MPRIIKNQNDNVITHSVLDEDLNDFLEDPELFRDPLPQPYRRIDRILEELFDETWINIENNETERNLENAKYRPNKISNLNALENLGDFNCMSSSTDDKSEFIFIGSNGSLTCIDSENMTIHDKVDLIDEKTQLKENITSVNSSRFNNQVHFVVTITESGSLYMHLFCMTKFHPIIFEMDTDRKYLYRKCEMAKNCTFIALFQEQNAKISPPDCLVEVFKCPKDAWAQYVENLYVLKQEEDNEVAMQQLPHIQKPNLLCKIKPPINLLKTSTPAFQNINQLLKLTETIHPEVIGTGANSCFTKAHLDLKTQTCEKFLNIHVTEEIANQITGNFEAEPKLDAEIEFMYQNRLLNTPIAYDQLIEIPNGLAICWNETTQIMFYPFTRFTKELESRVEYNMPFSSSITKFQLSKCNTLIGVVLKNCNLIVFDLIAGIDRCCVHFKNVESIKRVHFLPPPLPANTNMLSNKLTEFKVPTRLVCLLSNGEIHIVDCTLGANQQTENIFMPNLANKDDLCINFYPCLHLPNLLVVLSITNKLFIFDITKQKMLLELSNESQTHKHFINSEQIECALTIKDQLLYIRAQKGESVEESNGGSNDSLLICHQLRTIPVLEDYFAYNNSTQYYQSFMPCRTSLNDRIKILMEKRIDEQPSRKERLKKMWGEIQSHRNI